MYAGHSPTAKLIHEGFSWEVEVLFKYVPHQLRHLFPKMKLHRIFTFQQDKEAAYYLFYDICNRPNLRHVRILHTAPKLKVKQQKYKYKYKHRTRIMECYPPTP
jgi:hypothetical protein